MAVWLLRSPPSASTTWRGIQDQSINREIAEFDTSILVSSGDALSRHNSRRNPALHRLYRPSNPPVVSRERSTQRELQQPATCSGGVGFLLWILLA
jgi:hypothetical protein